MEAYRYKEVLKNLKPGKVYKWNELKQYSHSLGRDIPRLVQNGKLRKLGAGLYTVPKKTRFGLLPPDPKDVVQSFLKTDDFLMFEPNLYNSLNLGLTQLKNYTLVYNRKRHEVIKLSGQEFHFKRPNNGYPLKMDQAFLLVDLMNNLKDLGENEEAVKEKITKLLENDKICNNHLLETAQKYGKVWVRKFFETNFLKKK